MFGIGQPDQSTFAHWAMFEPPASQMSPAAVLQVCPQTWQLAGAFSVFTQTPLQSLSHAFAQAIPLELLVRFPLVVDVVVALVLVEPVPPEPPVPPAHCLPGSLSRSITVPSGQLNV